MVLISFYVISSFLIDNLFSFIKGDGDCSVSKRLAETRPYGPNFTIEKIECRNHLLRNYGTKLAMVGKNTKYPIHLRKHILNNAKRFRSAITKAIDYRNELKQQSKYQKVSGRLLLRTFINKNTCNTIK